jgi:HAE1 family hydrophobic/amphiphilic exporter-1
MQTINAAVKTIPVGRIRGENRELSVEFNADYSKTENLQELEIVNRNDGKVIYLKDIATVKMAAEEVRQAAYHNNEPCIAIKVVKRSDANAVKVVEQLKAAGEKIRQTLPAGMKLEWVSDDARFIQANADSAWENIFQGILLTSAILFFFLYDFKLLLITSVTMPLNIIIGFFFMRYLDYTLNLSTLIAIGMSVGILVTNSLVILESIMKKLEETGDPKTAAIEGTSACTIEILASSGTNIVVLFPISMIPGVIGLFLKPLAMTMLIVTAVSLFISFTVIPLLSALILKKPDKNATGILKRCENAFNRGLNRIITIYTGILELAQTHKIIGVGIILASLILLVQSLSLAGIIGGGFMPDSDMADITVKFEFPTSYSLDKTRARTIQAIDIARSIPETKSVLASIGKVEGVAGKSSEGVYLAEIKLRLSDKDERTLTLPQLLKITREKYANFTDAILTISIPSPTGGSNAPVQLEIYGEKLEVLDQTALQLKEKAEIIPGFTSVDTTVRAGKAKIMITPRRNVLSESEISAVGRGTSLRGNIAGLKAATFKNGDRNYDIVVNFAEQEGSRQIEDFNFRSKDGKPISLTNFGEIQQVIAPIQINRKDKQRVARFESFLEPSLALGNAIGILEKTLNDGLLQTGYSTKVTGSAEMMGEAQAGLAEAAIIAMILVVLTLSAIMESFVQPAIILLTLPPTLIGMLWGLYLTGNSISIFALMGGVMLIGIVVNNAILVLDHYNHLVHHENIAPAKAIIQASGERFRPVIMITIAAVLGMLPMALGTGIGSEMRCDVGAASAGGILSSGLISLFTIPIIYGFFLKKEPKKTAQNH